MKTIKTIQLLSEIIAKLDANKTNACDCVINVFLHAYELECALEATFEEFEEWLAPYQLFPKDQLERWYEKQYWLYIFRGEIQMYCQIMPLPEAISTVEIEFIK